MHAGVGYALFVVCIAVRVLRDWQPLDLRITVAVGCKFHILRGKYFRDCILWAIGLDCIDRGG